LPGWATRCGSSPCSPPTRRARTEDWAAAQPS
jgi:hypothetical protein